MIPIRDLNPTRTFPFFTILLIVANALVFAYELGQQTISSSAIDRFYTVYGIIPCRVSNSCPPAFLGQLEALHDPVSPAASLFTSLFVHGGWLHIAGNMLFLWIFGNNVEDLMGHARYAIFYFVCGLIATFAQIGFDPTSTVPSIGASGAIAGVLGAYFVTYPRVPVDTAIFVLFIFFVRLPAWLVLGFWIALQFFNSVAAVGAPNMGGVATFAHIGGFLAGMVLVFLFRRRPPPQLTLPVVV
ncbi:MAG: rhomboid family intramembrane serine protease [Chloroflexota bacterium]